jgi:hypothetical protein
MHVKIVKALIVRFVLFSLIHNKLLFYQWTEIEMGGAGRNE